MRSPLSWGPCIDYGHLICPMKAFCHGTKVRHHMYRGGRAAHRQASMEADILEEADERDADAPSLGGSSHLLLQRPPGLKPNRLVAVACHSTQHNGDSAAALGN